ncbi:MAG: Nif3-like dinuclear metal center hexameric protein, partial [Lachnospiraceae bacterium]|nr:Nif3-like dinuclear metal center hexameric protein [Lachnospiraceae bacterium]
LTVGELAEQIKRKGHFSGGKLTGNPETEVSTVFLAEHITGRDEKDKALIRKIDEEQIDVIIPLELVDYTVAEYIRDASCAGFGKALLSFGHFNTEELGMSYLEQYFSFLFNGKVDVIFCPSADMFQYL